MTDETTLAPDIITTSAGGASVTIQPQLEPSLDTASSQDLKNERTITDDLGHVIKLKRPNVIAEYRFIEMLGDSASNQVFFAMTMPLLWVVSIDNVAVPKPQTKGELYALMARLGDEGVAAILKDASDHMAAGTGDTEDKAKNG